MAKSSTPQVDEKWQAENDGRTLMDAQEIRNDSKRHGKALAHLKTKAKASANAVALEAKVKKGLVAAFPKDGCPTCGKTSCKGCK